MNGKPAATATTRSTVTQVENQENFRVLRHGCLTLCSKIMTKGGRITKIMMTATSAQATSVHIGELTHATVHALKLLLTNVSGAGVSALLAAASFRASCKSCVCAGIMFPYVSVGMVRETLMVFISKG